MEMDIFYKGSGEKTNNRGFGQKHERETHDFVWENNAIGGEWV